MIRGIVPNLWFDKEAEQAAAFYCSVFTNSRILSTARYPEGAPGPAGEVMTVEFELDGQALRRDQRRPGVHLLRGGVVRRSPATTRPRSTTSGTPCSRAAARRASAGGSRTASACPGRWCRTAWTRCSTTPTPPAPSGHAGHAGHAQDRRGGAAPGGRRRLTRDGAGPSADGGAEQVPDARTSARAPSAPPSTTRSHGEPGELPPSRALSSAGQRQRDQHRDERDRHPQAGGGSRIASSGQQGPGEERGGGRAGGLERVGQARPGRGAARRRRGPRARRGRSARRATCRAVAALTGPWPGRSRRARRAPPRASSPARAPRGPACAARCRAGC